MSSVTGEAELKAGQEEAPTQVTELECQSWTSVSSLSDSELTQSPEGHKEHLRGDHQIGKVLAIS